MTIRSGLEFQHDRVKIDLSGPDGNVFVLIRTGMDWGQRHKGWSKEEAEEFRDEMMSGTYDDAVEAFDREFGEYCDIYLPPTMEERQMVEEATEMKKKLEIVKEAQKFYEAVCKNNSGYEDSFEEGIAYRVVKRGKSIITVEDMMGEPKEVLAERFGTVEEVVVAQEVLTPKESKKYLVTKLQEAIRDDSDKDTVKVLRTLKKYYNGRENWFEELKTEISVEEYKEMHKIILRQLRIEL